MSQENPSPGKENHSGPITDQGLQQMHAQLLREKVEPSEGFPPMPIAILFLFATVTFVVGVYFVNHIAGFDWRVTDPNWTEGSVVAARPAFDPMKVGQRIYNAQCLQCHQADGKGVSGAFPPLEGADWVLASRVRPTAILLHGLVGPIEVRGNTYNGNMPAFGSLLSDREIGAVLTYVRASWGNNAEAITEEHVAAIRAKVGSRGSPWSAEELLALSPMPELQLPEPEAEAEGAPEEGLSGDGAEATGAVDGA